MKKCVDWKQFSFFSEKAIGNMTQSHAIYLEIFTDYGHGTI